MRSRIRVTGALRCLLLVFAGALLVACATPGQRTSAHAAGSVLTPDTVLRAAPPVAPSEAVDGIDLSSETAMHPVAAKPEIQVGTGRFFDVQPARRRGGGEGQVTFNFENQPIQAVVKAILGDMLQENYTIAPNVGGNVTYSTSRPIRREDAMPVLEMLLSWTGNALVDEDGRYTVLPAKDAIPGKLTPELAVAQRPGYALRIFPLHYVSASQMATLLKPYAKGDAFVSIDPNRSLLVLAGTPSELANYERTINTFDVDWLAGMSVGVFALQHVEAAKLMPDLLKIFGTDGESPLAGMFRFMPIEQTNSIIVITPQQEYLKRAEEWLYRLDQGGAENSTRLYVYNVKNLKAPDLADYLSEIFLGTTGVRRSTTSGTVAPGLRSTTLGSRGGMGGGPNSMSYGSSLRPQSNQEKAAPVSAPPAPSTGASAGPAGGGEADIRISAIEENNQLMIQATPVQWDRIESAIRRLDVVPLQVQIEARILEVTLSGDLQYGVQWWLGNLQTANGQYENPRGPYPYPNPHNRHGSTFGMAGPAAAKATMFWSFINSKFQVQLSALETSGLAKSLAAPSLLVMNNQEAQINVGTQIPVQQTYFTGIGGINANNQAIGAGYGTVQYLNTGVTLNVRPRVNPGGLVYLDIQQEVSNPGTASVQGGNPPINQRQIQTQVAVQSGETLLLGGLIQDNKRNSSGGVPLVNRLPIVRNLFGSTSDSSNRTELIVLITPRVIASVDEAREATLEYSRQFESLVPLQRTERPAAAQAPASPPAAQTHPVHDANGFQEEPPSEH